MRLIIFIFVVMLTTQGGAATIPANPNLDAPARAVLSYLDSIYGNNTLAGYNTYSQTPDTYEQVGKRAVIVAQEMKYLPVYFSNISSLISDIKESGYILTIHWHWKFMGESYHPWERPAGMERPAADILTPGTDENIAFYSELSATADKLQLFEDAGVPILWRPFHEIDGGWFWWTDQDTPANTAALWRLMFDYLTTTRGLNNLIWVYSAGEYESRDAEYRAPYYPGADYVDISGVDIYHIDFEGDEAAYWTYWNTMSAVSPGKMLALPECDSIPDPDKMADGTTPKWLYALPWWGVPWYSLHPLDWANFTHRHDFVITREEAPAFYPGETAPTVGILEPRDDGTAVFLTSDPVIEAYAVDRDGSIANVTFKSGDTVIGSDSTSPYSLVWADAPAGSWTITAEATDNTGLKTTSNAVRVTVGLSDLAKDKTVVVSSGTNGGNAVNGNYYSPWTPENANYAWIYVDLGSVIEIEQVNMFWGWKIHAEDFTIEVATSSPEDAGSWTSVHTTVGRVYVPWKATDRIALTPVNARYVRLSMTDRTQSWGAYQLDALEVLSESSDPGPTPTVRCIARP